MITPLPSLQPSLFTLFPGTRLLRGKVGRGGRCAWPLALTHDAWQGSKHTIGQWIKRCRTLLELERDSEAMGAGGGERETERERTDPITSPHCRHSLSITSNHSLVHQQWLSNFLTKTHTYKYILYYSPRKVSANNT